MNPVSDVEILNFDSMNQLAEQLPRRHRYFTLLLAWDAPDIERHQLIALVKQLVDRGLVYFCAWGRRCKEMHDAVDLADMERIQRPDHEDYIIMTTWHHDEPLEEALWFFNNLAVPTEEPFFSDLDRFAVAIGNCEWATSIELGLAAQDE